MIVHKKDCKLSNCVCDMQGEKLAKFQLTYLYQKKENSKLYSTMKSEFS